MDRHLPPDHVGQLAWRDRGMVMKSLAHAILPAGVLYSYLLAGAAAVNPAVAGTYGVRACRMMVTSP